MVLGRVGCTDRTDRHPQNTLHSHKRRPIKQHNRTRRLRVDDGGKGEKNSRGGGSDKRQQQDATPGRQTGRAEVGGVGGHEPGPGQHSGAR